MKDSSYTHTYALPGHPPQKLELQGLPSHFHLVTHPTSETKVEEIIQQTSFTSLLLMLRGGLPITDIAGLFTDHSTARKFAEELFAEHTARIDKIVTLVTEHAPQIEEITKLLETLQNQEAKSPQAFLAAVLHRHCQNHPNQSPEKLAEAVLQSTRTT